MEKTLVVQAKVMVVSLEALKKYFDDGSSQIC